MKKNYQRWVLINKQGHLVGRLEHDAYNIRASAKEWFQMTSSLTGNSVNIDDLLIKIGKLEKAAESDAKEIDRLIEKLRNILEIEND